jgi:hypothetical protein
MFVLLDGLSQLCNDVSSATHFLHLHSSIHVYEKKPKSYPNIPVLFVIPLYESQRKSLYKVERKLPLACVSCSLLILDIKKEYLMLNAPKHTFLRVLFFLLIGNISLNRYFFICQSLAGDCHVSE